MYRQAAARLEGVRKLCWIKNMVCSLIRRANHFSQQPTFSAFGSTLFPSTAADGLANSFPELPALQADSALPPCRSTTISFYIARALQHAAWAGIFPLLRPGETCSR